MDWGRCCVYLSVGVVRGMVGRGEGWKLDQRRTEMKQNPGKVRGHVKSLYDKEVLNKPS